MPGPPAVTLRARTADDLDIAYRLASDLDTWEEREPGPPEPLIRERFEQDFAQASSDSSGKVVRFMIDVDGETVGGTSMFGFDPFARHAEVGINLLREARGRGIGSAAIAQLVEFGFVRRNLRRIHLQAVASNVGAIRAYEKAGFVVEGRLREHAWVRGRYEDIVIMGILRSAQR